MRHWLHILVGRRRRLSAFAAGELPLAARSRLKANVRHCAGCRRELEAFQLVAKALRHLPTAALSLDEAETLWTGVESRLDGATVPMRLARPGLKELAQDHRVTALASASLAILLVLGAADQFGLWRTRHGQSSVEILSVESEGGAPVMIFEPPGNTLKIIWVFDQPE